jgi:uncharacterized membrane protein
MIHPIALVLLILSTIFGGVSTIYLKKASHKFSLKPKKLLKNHNLFVGVFLSGISLLVYIPALEYENLSRIYPLSSFTYVLVAFLSVKYLKEKMNFFKWTGIIFIILGSFFVI